MAKFKITREEQIPFRESDNTVIQMIQHKVGVTVEQEGEETLADIEKQLDEVFARNMEKTLAKDPVYQRHKRQLNMLVQKIKKYIPDKATEIILEVKKL